MDSEKDELATLKIERWKKRFSSDRLTLTIAPSLECNMDCPYCYEKKGSIVISSETQGLVVEFAKKQLAVFEDVKRLVVNWYGGEPLLQLEVIFTLTKALKELCKEKEIEYGATLISNGVLLDGRVAEKLAKECSVSQAQITIDGIEPVHDRRRRMKDGSGSFQTIVSNLESAKKYMGIVVRVNVDRDNISSIDEMTKYFLDELKWSKNPLFYLAPVEEVNEGCIIDKTRCFGGEEFAEIDMACVKAQYKKGLSKNLWLTNSWTCALKIYNSQ